MRKPHLLGGVLALLLSAQASLAQDMVLTGILAALAPGARVSWDSGVAQSGRETYEGLFLRDGRVRLRGDQVRVVPDGPVARIEADRLVLNLDGDDRFAVELNAVTLQVSAAALLALRADGALPDLCGEEGAGAALEARGVRILRDVGTGPEGRVRAEARIDQVRIDQEVRRVEGGCVVTLSGLMEGGQEARPDKSGVRVDRADISLTLPGNVATLTSGKAPDLTLTLGFGGVLRQIPGGATVVSIRDGAAEGRLAALSAVPALTALLRTRGLAAPDRAAAVISALTPADLGGSARLNGTTLLAEALIPAGLISGLSRASLTSLIGDYEAGVEAANGRARLRLSSNVVGVGETDLSAALRIAPRRPDAPPLGLDETLERVLPDLRLEGAELRHRDLGLLRAIELITGSPVSVLAAIYIQEGADAVPEAWRPATSRAVNELARFFSLTPKGEGALLRLSTPQDLSVPETYRLLTLRPELADQLIVTEVTQAPPKGP